MWCGGSSAERKRVDKHNGQPVQCFLSALGD